MARKLSRRDFIKASFVAGGALMVSCYSKEPIPTETTTPEITATNSLPETATPFQPNMYIRIDPDGTTNLFIHRSEMGQGVRTSLAMILAEELDADWTKVRVEQMDANPQVNQITSGSGSIMLNYSKLRQMGSVARMILVNAAAQFWSITPDECRTENGGVIRVADENRIDYGKLVALANKMDLKPLPELKDPKDFKLIGTSVPRVDEPDIVTGRAVYGLDVRVPNMKFAVVARPPVLGGKLAGFDPTSAESVAGVLSVFEIPSGVAIVAENSWSAMQGRLALQAAWDDGENASLSSAGIRQKLADAVNAAKEKEEPTTLTTIEAIYETPYLAHAAMEPVNCVADVRANKVELWLPTQNPQAVQEYVSGRFNLATTVHVTLLGGGFGRKLEVDYALEAAEVSKAFGGPVQVVWTRDDDIRNDFYRQVTYHRMRAGWDADGNLGMWQHHLAAQGISGIAYHGGVDVLNEDIGVLYNIDGKVSRSFVVNFPVHTGPWRGVVSATNAFANECFIDEVAAALGKDPLEFRLSRLRESEQLRKALELAAEKSGWGTSLPQGYGRGIACHKTYGQTSVAMVAEVSVEDGTLHIQKVTCAINCGKVVHPDMVKEQMEGSIAFGLTALLKGEITIEKGRIQQSNFYDYPLLQMSEMPEVEVYIVEDDRSPLGLGEMGVPPITPAVVNAIYAATGVRIRRTPIRDEDLKK